MKKLNLQIKITTFGGDRIARMMKQNYKCSQGSSRACRRALRIFARTL